MIAQCFVHAYVLNSKILFTLSCNASNVTTISRITLNDRFALATFRFISKSCFFFVSSLVPRRFLVMKILSVYPVSYICHSNTILARSLNLQLICI